MPNWKKVVVSGSNAAFNSVFVTNHVTASGAISSSNSLFFSSSLSSDMGKKWFIIEGNIGTGKSTFLKKLKEDLNCEIIYEPLEK